MNDRIQEIKRRYEAATPGTWNSTGDAVRCDHSPNGWICQMFEGSENSEEQTRDFENAFINAEFIANAPDDIAYLLSEVERLQTGNKVMKEALEKSERFISAMMEFYGEGLTVYNWHQNGDGEPWDNFFDNNMEGDELTSIRTALSHLKG